MHDIGAPGATAAFDFGNVWACSPTATNGPTPFDENGTDSFQCVELSARYLWAIWGLWVPHPSDGWDLVDHVHASYPTRTTVATASPSSVPGIGHVISFGPGGSVDPSVGHTAVVVSATDPTTGRFVVLSQNFPEGLAGKQTWRVDLTGHHNGKVQLVGSTVWTSADWLVLPPPPISTTLTPAAGHPADPVCTNSGFDQGTTSLTLQGKYYYKDEGAQLLIRSKNVILDYSPRVVVSPKGTWPFPFPVPSRPYGNYPVTVADAGGVVARLTFASGAYTCFQWSGSDWQWDAVGWDAYSPMTFSIDGVQMDHWSAFSDGSLPIRLFQYDCPVGTHYWEVTGTLGTAPGYAAGYLTCSSTATHLTLGSAAA